MTLESEVVIVGAGPYGLSIAAHLQARDVPHRIFGTPMQTWRTQMLRDSRLKSEGFATSLYEPSGSFTLKAYCSAAGLPYADVDLPVRLSTFAEYGLAFQRRYVPQLEDREIISLTRTGARFTLRAADGEMFTARRVIVAVGISRFHYLPPLLAEQPSEYVTHSSAHTTVDQFAERDVVVVGAGASAFDMALELLGVGARVRVVARRNAIAFNGRPRPRSLRDRIRAPMSGLGPGWKSQFYTDAPLLFHCLPEQMRVDIVRRHLGPAPCWFTRDAVDGKAEYLLARQLRGAAIDNGRIRLRLERENGTAEDIVADHVIAATGYRVDLQRLDFFSDELRSAIRMCGSSPALSMNFESSIPGLYFAGATAANSFGPVCRFAFGARFTSARLSACLAHAATAAPRTTERVPA